MIKKHWAQKPWIQKQIYILNKYKYYIYAISMYWCGAKTFAPFKHQLKSDLHNKQKTILACQCCHVSWDDFTAVHQRSYYQIATSASVGTSE